MTQLAEFERSHGLAVRLLDNVEQVVHGKRQEVQLVLSTLIAGGHVLLEDVPGTAKTVLARAIAGSVAGATTTRIQCTPDLQPTDVTGLSVFDPKEREFEFRPGPIFANIVLVDEINRAMPKTQSALLEAMAEHQVTADGATRQMPDPFLLIATENPIEQEGTFPLPEAQLDRFFVRTALGYPNEDNEVRILEEQVLRHPLTQLAPVVTLAETRELRNAATQIYVDPIIRRWIVRLIRATRVLEGVEVGASVRGGLALERVARAQALIEGRTYVTPADIEDLFLSVVAHRIVFTPAFVAEAREMSWAAAMGSLLERCLGDAPWPGDDLDERLAMAGAA